MTFYYKYIILFLTLYFYSSHNVLSVHLKESLHNTLQMTHKSAVTTQSQSKFIDKLLYGILQLLLSTSSRRTESPSTSMSRLYPPNQLPTSQYEVPEPVPLAEPDIPESSETLLHSSSSEPSEEALPKETPETFISAGLTAQSTAMEKLNKQLAILTNEVVQWKQLEEENVQKPHASNTSADVNQIQLTIRYPGTGANETQNTFDEQKEKDETEQRKEMLELAGGSLNNSTVDPTKLRVPVLIIAPEPVNNYEETLQKLIKESLTPGTEAEQIAQLQSQFMRSLSQQRNLGRSRLKTALANAAFFEKDLKLSTLRLESVDAEA